MVRVAPIKLQYNPRTLWFDPQDFEIHKGEAVVVKTARGIEFGRAADDIIEVEEAEIKKLKTELKPVIRIATSDDEARSVEMQVKSDEALPIFKEMAAEANDDMHPVSVEYLLDGDKAVFFFEAEERVDFRDLVRKLASHFHVRVDMRQIGVRDEARMVGGYGHCGQELCCKRLGGEFCPVSIRMAKEQDLSLNPQKISGVCGRLMCCLRYEFDVYKEFKSRAPKQNSMVETPEGSAKVVELDMPKELVGLRTSGGKNVKIPLAEMETSEGGSRPDTVPADVFDAYANPDVLDTLTDASLLTPHFTGEDKLADPKARKQKNARGGGRNDSRRQSSKSDEQASTETRKPRRRRTTVGADGQEAASGEAKKQNQGSNQKKRSGQRKKPGGGNQQNQAQGQGRQQSQRQGAAKSSQKQGSGARPGQKSSGLRSGEGSKDTTKGQRDRSQGESRSRSKNLNQSQTQGQSRSQGQSQNRSQSQNPAGESTHRKARRRSHKANGGDDAGQAKGGDNG